MAGTEIGGRRAFYQKLVKLYEICLELDIHGAKRGNDWNEKEITRFSTEIQQYLLSKSAGISPPILIVFFETFDLV
jgi:hypothetical protein